MSQPSSIDPVRQRIHAERMLHRAEGRHKQAVKLVEKWKERLAVLDKEGIAIQQPTLWAEIINVESAEDASTPDTLAP